MAGVSEVIKNNEKLNVIGKLIDSSSSSRFSLAGLSRSRFFLKAQDGCNYSCSYCLIPKARGLSRSIALTDLIEQAREASECFNEIAITGIHLGSYGLDLNPRTSLSELVEAILRETDIKRIRLGSLEIREIDDRLLELLADKRLCRHLHIPLQSCDEKILMMMNRSYNLKDIVEGFGRISFKFPEISIGTDIIAGFPGEGEEQFTNTYSLLESLPLSYIHVFPFSVRQGTKASEMPNAVASPVMKERCMRLRRLGQRKKSQYMLSQVGKTLDLLVEEKTEGNCCSGTTGNYLKLSAASIDACVRDIVFVRVTGASDNSLTGCLI